MPRHRPLIERLLAQIDSSGEHWLWTGTTTPKGYGIIGVNGKKEYVHRVMWMFTHEDGVPSGLFVCHHCDIRNCVTPGPTEHFPQGHLFLGTNADNLADMAEKGRAACGSTNARAKLTEAAVVEARLRHAAGETMTVIAQAFGVSLSAIFYAVSGQSWKHI